jgi:putative SOS response-associated peptidase YedK
MCGRATLTTPGDELREQLDLDVVPTMVPRFNIAPSQPIAIIRTPRILSFAAFGLSAFTGKPGRTINLRAESLPNVPAYREAFQRHRCLVVVDGFFEWKELPDLPTPQAGLFADAKPKSKAKKPKKQPFLIRRTDGAAFTLAAVWAPIAGRSPANDDAVECAIVTGAAAGVVAEMHDRMPVIVPASAREIWLSGADDPPGRMEASTRDRVKALLAKDAVSSGAAELVATAVGPRVNNAAYDDEEVLRPADGASHV